MVCGGGRPEGLDRGYYFEPTVLDIPDNANPAAQEEIFGPVIAVLGYRDLDHAVAIANDSIYGLSGQVYGADVAAAVGVARRLRTGAVNVNTTVFSAYAPSGGYKQSGLGRERGPDGIREFQEVKHMSIGELATMTITDTRNETGENGTATVDLELVDLGRRPHPRAAESVGRSRRFQGPGPRAAHGGRRQGRGHLGLRR